MSHFDLNDNAFLIAFENATLRPQLFNHTAHIRLAWLLLKKHPEEKAMALTCEQIHRFDKLHGDGKKFHYTLTAAAVKIVSHFMAKSISEDFNDFLHEFPVLLKDFPGLIYKHYTKDRLLGEEAKKQFVYPNLLPIT